MSSMAAMNQGMNGATQQLAEVGTQNPSPAQAENGHFSTSNVSLDDQAMLKDIITEYRSDWMQDRLERGRQWMQNLFYWKGIQVIEWDSASNGWYDVLAWSRSQNQDSGEDTDLERWVNPLVLMFCNVFTGILSREVPKSIVKPENADASLQDTVTAKSAVKLIRIIERKNQFRKMVRSIYEMLYLFGCYFRYTRPVIDGDMFGYDEVASFEDMQIEMGPHYVCPKCGTEVPADQDTTCPNCGTALEQQHFYGAGEGNRSSMKMAGVKKVPRPGIKWSLHSPLEIDVDPKAKGDNPLRMTPILAKDCEIDIGEARSMFPNLREQIQPGAESPTTPNASVERLERLNAVSVLGGYTADVAIANPTYSEVWVQPMAYEKKDGEKGKQFAQRMRKQFPEGLKISFVGELVADIRAAVLTKDWSHAALYANQGVFCAALANTVVSFNARFNRAMWIIDDSTAKTSTGLNLANAGIIDTEKMSGKAIPAGTIIGVPMKLNGLQVPFSEMFAHYDLPLNPAILNYPEMLMTFCELIIGIPRQSAGQGTQADVDTFHGQQLMVNRSTQVLKPYFENVKDEHARASQNAFSWTQELMKTGALKAIRDVVAAQGGAYHNEEVDWEHMQGNVNFIMDEDQDLPISPEELRTAIQTMFQELTKGNPAAVEWFSVPANQDRALSTMLPGSVLPDEAQTLKTEADIQKIIESGPQMKLNPDGSVGQELAAYPTKQENFSVAKQVVQRYMLEHFELRVEDPVAWIGLGQYYDALLDLETNVASDTAKRQTAVTQAGAPPKQQPDPQTMAAVQELQKLAVQMADRLAQISMIDPMVTKQTATAQKDAAGKIIDSALDATKAITGEQ